MEGVTEVTVKPSCPSPNLMLPRPWWFGDGQGAQENAPGEGPGGRERITSQDSVLRWVFWREEGLELLLKVELGGKWRWVGFGVEIWLGLELGLA